MVSTKWLAALSDGTTAIEGVGLFAEVRGELSPWQKLVLHMASSGVTITGMRIQVAKPGEATRTYNLPSLNKTPRGNHEKWATLWPLEVVRYDYRRWVTRTITTGRERHHIEIRAEYEGLAVSLFVDEDEGNESWVVVHGGTK